ncbi:hypothetical protein ACVWYG_003739 [Pedobacter sp. UYEF25]
MKKQFSLTAVLVLLIGIPMAFSQITNQKSLEYMQGNGVYEDGVWTFLVGFKNGIWGSQSATFIADAKALAAIFMIIYFAIKSYEMMSGDKKLEIMPLLRPFALVMIIIWWKVFCQIIAFPTDLVAQRTEEMFKSEQANVDNLRIIRSGYMLQLANSLYSFQADTEVAAKESDNMLERAWDSVTSTVKEGMATVISPLLELRNRLQVGMQLLFTQLLELLGLWILRVGVYLVFLLQIIYSNILIILGPFAVAVSILPAFKDSLHTWIGRFVSVNLYSGVAYLIMYIVANMQKYAMESEISKYKELLGVDGTRATIEKLAFFAGNGILSFGTVIVTCIIGAICMFTVPSISTWIISTSGISSAASNFGRGAGIIVGSAKKSVGVIL